MQEKMRGLYRPLGALAGQQPPAAPLPPQPLAQYAGRYASAYYGGAEVQRSGDALDLVLGPARVRYRLRHWSGDQFVFTPEGESAPPGSVSAVQFSLDGGHRAVQMQIEYFGEDTARGLFARVADGQ